MKKSSYSKVISLILVISLSATLFIGCSSSKNVVDSYYDKPLTFIVHAGAGGNLDLKVRIVAKYLEDIIGQTVVIENQPGAGGVTAATNYLQEKANTRKILVMGDAMFSIAPRNTQVQYKLEDYMPIIGLDVVKAGLFVNPDKIKSFEDYIAYGKENTILMGDNGKASGSYLSQAVLNNLACVDFNGVTYKSAAESLTNVYAGHIDACWAAMRLGEQYVEEGTLKPLLTFAPEDFTYANGTVVPSAKSLGIDMEHQNFLYFALRSGTEQQIIDNLYTAINQVYENKDFSKEMKAMNVALYPSNSQETSDYVKTIIKDIDRFYEIIQ